MPELKIDASAFESAYKIALPDELEEVKKEATKKSEDAGLPMPLFENVTLGSFCTQWPKVRKFLKMAISFAGWFSPGPAAMARAFVTAFERTILPVVCPIPPAE